MANDVLVVAERSGDQFADITFELLGKAKEIAASLGGKVGVASIGKGGPLDSLGAADVAYEIDHDTLADYSPQAFEAALMAIVEQAAPRVILMGTSTLGLDLAGAISVKWDALLASYIVELSVEGSDVIAVAQLYGGKLMAETVLSGDRAVCTVIPGNFPADAGRSSGAPQSVSVQPPEGLNNLKARFKALKEPDTSGVDITVADLLVSVGRGIGNQDNLELVQELADALGAPLSASRPIIDQGWLPKPHQVGKSGQKVKPKAYLSFGISGAPEHLEGMRNSDLIIACNTDEGAPIFEVAHFGTTIDLFDLLPELSERLGG